MSKRKLTMEQIIDVLKHRCEYARKFIPNLPLIPPMASEIGKVREPRKETHRDKESSMHGGAL